MTDDQIAPVSDEELPPLHLELRNMEGEDSEIRLATPLLGMEPYLLLTIEDDGFHLTGSHLTPDDAAGGLAYVLTALLHAEGVSEETREEARYLLSADDDEIEVEETRR